MSYPRATGVRLVVAAALVALAAPAFAQQQPQPLTVHRLTDNVYWAEGGGGNSGIVIGTTGVVIVDAKTTAAAGRQLLDEVAKLTDKPVTHVIETHSDGDHINGLASFPAGVTVVAHRGNQMEQEEATRAGGRGAPPAGHAPSMVIAQDAQTVTLDGVRFELHHWAPAHTSGDLVVYLPDQRIVFTGDIVATQREDPIIHLEKHGSTAGWITTMQGIGGLDADTFVPGHGDVQTKAQIQARLQDVSGRRDRIMTMFHDGDSLEQVKQAMGDPAPQANAGGRGGGPAFGTLTEIVKQEMDMEGQQ